MKTRLPLKKSLKTRLQGELSRREDALDNNTKLFQHFTFFGSIYRVA
jgi:hypothetical protein